MTGRGATGPAARGPVLAARAAGAGRLLAEALRADYLAATLGGVFPCSGSARLYRPGAYQVLTAVDDIVPAPENAASIDTGVARVYRDNDGDLYVLWPAALAKFVTVLRPSHPADPLTYPYALGARGGGFFDVGSAIAGSSAYGGSLLYGEWSAMVLAFLAHPAPGEEAVRRARWRDFLNLHVAGTSGGPCGPDGTLGAQVNGANVALPSIFGGGRRTRKFWTCGRTGWCRTGWTTRSSRRESGVTTWGRGYWWRRTWTCRRCIGFCGRGRRRRGLMPMAPTGAGGGPSPVRRLR